MKKTIFLFVLILTGGYVSAQIFSSNRIQNPAEITRVILWDKPVTDSLSYQGIMPGNMRVLTMFTPDRGIPLFVLGDSVQYMQAQGYFTDSFMQANTSTIVGYEYVVSYLGKFSWLSKRALKKLSGMQKITAAAFNESEKYTLMAQAPRTVYGRRLANGTIVLKSDVPQAPQVPPVVPPVEPKKEEVKKFKPPTPPSVSNTDVEQKKEIPPPGEWKRDKRN